MNRCNHLQFSLPLDRSAAKVWAVCELKDSFFPQIEWKSEDSEGSKEEKTCTQFGHKEWPFCFKLGKNAENKKILATARPNVL